MEEISRKDGSASGLSKSSLDTTSCGHTQPVVVPDETIETNREKKIRMIEFFSGIGGMRMSIEKALRLLNNGHQRKNNWNSKDDTNTTTTRSQTQQSEVFALERCRAYDISLHANNVYRHNFCTATSKQNRNNSDSVCTKLVEQLSPKDVAWANLWTMSPPCQPFTTNGKGKQQLDANDKRCNGLKGIISLLDALDFHTEQPNWILLENVKGFGTSQMCQLFCESLKRNGYRYKAFCISPVDLGIPNHRARYYLLAEKCKNKNNSIDDDERLCVGEEEAVIVQSQQNETATTSSSSNDDTMQYRCDDSLDKTKNYAATPFIHDSTALSKSQAMRPMIQHAIGRYIENEWNSSDIDNSRAEESSNNGCDDNDTTTTKTNPYLVPLKVLSKAWSKGLGIVSVKDKATHCFTAGYGRIYHRSTGSLLLIPNSKADIDRNKASLSELPLDRSNMTMYQSQLRRLTPEELLKLFGFVDIITPNDEAAGDSVVDQEGDEKTKPITTEQRFEIPSSVVPSLEQRYKLIGNSISVTVVTELLCELLSSGVML